MMKSTTSGWVLLLLGSLSFSLGHSFNPPPSFTPEAKAIVLPYERAKAIRGCVDCGTKNKTLLNDKDAATGVCMSAGCHPLGTRCSYLPRLGSEWVTVSSHHCLLDSGTRGSSLYCCQKGSREALNILTLRARPNQYPHHVYLGIKAMDPQSGKIQYLHCGGTIIHPWWILSAAHCTNGPPLTEGGPPLKALMAVALVGQNHVKIAEASNRVEIDLEASIDHPSFSYSPFLHDITLLRLKSPLTFSGFVAPIPIASPDFMEAGAVEIIGYGKTDVTRSLSVLLTDTATVMDNARCGTLTKAFKPESVMCVGGENEPVPNQGDSGGPAICRDGNNAPVLCGITSYITEHTICGSGKRKRLNIREGEALPAGCGYPPAVYTRVSKYHDWIMDNIRRLTPSSSMEGSA